MTGGSRSRLGVGLATLVFFGRSASAEEAVARVAEAGSDVPVLVQLPVERRGENLHVRVLVQHLADPFGRRHQTHEADPMGVSRLERANGSGGRATGSEHRVEY